VRPNRKSHRSAPGGERRVGLARALSKLGYCSRAQAFDLIRLGNVSLNGRVRLDPETHVNLALDSIQVNGRTIAETDRVYLALNKPRGLVTTASDEKGKDTVYSLLPGDLPWIAPVGRLDKASEGLLLFTNDSEWAARITDPGSHLEKIYHVQVAAQPSEALISTLKKGIATEGGLLRARRVALLRAGEKNCWLEISLDEGRNRQIRRMLSAVGVEVLRLVRVAIGPLSLGDLPKGNCRRITAEEKHALDAALSLKQPLR
jgi:23S rRNA pseudouridine2605 synthase